MLKRRGENHNARSTRERGLQCQILIADRGRARGRGVISDEAESDKGGSLVQLTPSSYKVAVLGKGAGRKGANVGIGVKPVSQGPHRSDT